MEALIKRRSENSNGGKKLILGLHAACGRTYQGKKRESSVKSLRFRPLRHFPSIISVESMRRVEWRNLSAALPRYH